MPSRLAANALSPPVPPVGHGAGVPTAPDVGSPTPAERLARSRDEIRELMKEISAPHQRRRPVAGAAQGAGAAGPSMVDSLLDKAQSLPGVSVLLEAARGWWAHHPWRVVTLVAADAGRAAITPVAQRHPVALVLGAALFGAMAFRWGPWRWLVKPAVLAGFLPRLLTRAAGRVPIESWLSGLAVFSRPCASTKSDPRP